MHDCDILAVTTDKKKKKTTVFSLRVRRATHF